MSGVWLYLLGGINLAVGLYSLMAGARYLAYVRRYLSQAPRCKRDEPTVTLLVPCCGDEDGLEENLRALFRQDYPELDLVFIVESESDPALPVIHGLLASEYRDARVITAGPAEARGQKVHNLLAGLEPFPASEVLAFADSDVRPDSGWLARLVEPLTPGGRQDATRSRAPVGVTTGYRFYLPEAGSFASILRSVWNAGVLTLLGDHDHNFAWGGSMAIRGEVFRKAGIRKAWERSLSDDYALTHAARRAGYRVEFLPSCLVGSAGSVSLRELLRWCARQMAVTRIYWPNLWRIAGGSQVLFVAFMTAGTAAAIQGDTTTAVLLGAVLALGGVSGRLRARAVRLLVPRWEAPLGRYTWAYVLWLPLAGLLTFYAFCRSAVSRRIEWRGKTYEMRSPTETIIL
ncbi:MAG: glycosyltransferase [Acidobacteriota bacterium]